MKSGKAFEIFVKRLLINVGFSEVESDGLYIFDGAPGQMIQGLGEAHNADVLLEPPVQTPFLTRTRLLIECKDYKKKIGLNMVRGALGLREDVNHFDLVDINELMARRNQRRDGLLYNYDRFSYQVALVSSNGYTVQAQKFAATHRIPLLEFDKMPFWKQLIKIFDEVTNSEKFSEKEIIDKICRLADNVGKRIAVAITNSGQMLFLYRTWGEESKFSDNYSLFFVGPELPWKLLSGGHEYCFQLPDSIMKQWLNNAANEIERRKEAIVCKERFLSNMIVYYVKDGCPAINMISIDKDRLSEAKSRLKEVDM